MALAQITEEQRKHVIDDIQLDFDQLKNKIEQLKEWMKKEPHMPDLPDDYANKLFKVVLMGTKLSTETAKHKIDTLFAMRHQYPDLFSDGDPTQEDVKASVDIIRYFPVSELTPDGVRVFILSFNTEKKFSTPDIKALYKRIFNSVTVLCQMEEFSRGQYVVIDCSGFFLSHVTELPFFYMQKITVLLQEALPIRIKGVFVINAAGYMDTVHNILKPVYKEKLRKRIQLFQGDHTNVYKFIPKRILPKDFGGEAPPIAESSRAWHKSLESMKDFLMEDAKLLTDESRRPHDSPNDCGQIFGINGTFNKLNID